jgi:hypothetical protein
VSLPIGALVVILVLALAVLGVGYGLWSKTLMIQGTIETGRVDARWTMANCSEFYPWPGGGNPGEFEGKDVGRTTATIDANDDQIVHVTIHNGYPSYAVDCELHFINDGTIPVIVRGTTIVPVSQNLTNCQLSGDQTKYLRCDQLTVKLVDGIGSQIDPGPEDESSSSLVIHVEQPAAMNTTYKFDVIECMAQWNEGATEAECLAAAP